MFWQNSKPMSSLGYPLAPKNSEHRTCCRQEGHECLVSKFESISTFWEPRTRPIWVNSPKLLASVSYNQHSMPQSQTRLKKRKAHLTYSVLGSFSPPRHEKTHFKHLSLVETSTPPAISLSSSVSFRISNFSGQFIIDLGKVWKACECSGRLLAAAPRKDRSNATSFYGCFKRGENGMVISKSQKEVIFTNGSCLSEWINM